MTASLISSPATAETMQGSGAAAASSVQPPVAKKVPKETKINGDTLVDNYFWLREKSNPEVAAYLESENAYTDSLMAPTKDYQSALYKELLRQIMETDFNVPYKDVAYFYYSRTEQGNQYPIFCRKRGSLEAPEEVMLDENELAKGEKFMSLGALDVSDDGNWLAYSTDNTGFRQYTLHVKDLRTGKLSNEAILKTGSVVWANDNKTVFYTIEDSAKRQYRLYRHVVGATDPDALVYEEKDEAFSIGAGKSLSKKYIFLESGSHTTSESRYLPADQPSGEWKLIAPRIHDQEYYPDHRGDSFVIRTNRAGRNFEFAVAPVSDPRRENWKTIIPARADVMLSGVTTFADYLVITERAKALPQMRVIDLRKSDLKAGKLSEHSIPFADAVYMAAPGANREWNTTVIRYNYQSPITPSSVYDYDMVNRTSKLMKQTEVPGGFDRNNYELERVYATAKDGVKIPLTVFYKKGVKRDGTAPLYLYGYGSYGNVLPVNFSSSRLALLDRGVVVALAHIRGGGDMGKPWHDDGRMMKKMNTFTDFIASAEYLVAEKYADRSRIVIEGGSAGGLLMGAVTSMRPDLWKAVLTKVPFVDVLNTMLDASLPLTVGEYEEWGNPNKKPDYDYMKQYSPYDNLQAKKYPTIMVKTSFNDSQVMYWEPAKYVAKLRTLKPADDTNPLMLKTNMAAGHGGASGRYDFLHDVAFDYAFILTQLGINQ
jgi:oligopeptidase B